MALERTFAKYEKIGEDILLTTNPCEVAFSDFSIHVVSKYLFKKGSGEIVTTRVVLEDFGDREIEIEDYLVGCYGIDEYSEDMTGITLEVESKENKESIPYLYKCRNLEMAKATARAIVPQIKTIVEMGSEDKESKGRIEEGIAFSPMVRLSNKKSLKGKGEFTTWLKVKKAD